MMWVVQSASSYKSGAFKDLDFWGSWQAVVVVNGIIKINIAVPSWASHRLLLEHINTKLIWYRDSCQTHVALSECWIYSSFVHFCNQTTFTYNTDYSYKTFSSMGNSTLWLLVLLTFIHFVLFSFAYKKVSNANILTCLQFLKKTLFSLKPKCFILSCCSINQFKFWLMSC